MENRIKAAFDNIHADQKIVRHTKATLRRKSFDYGRDIPAMRARKFRRAVCMAMLALTLLGAGAYRMPTAAIDIDINPSIEMKVNAFDKVVSVKGLNDDGKAVVKNMELENMPYTQAMRRLLLSDEMEHYLAGGDMLSITVVGNINGEEVLRNAVCSASAVVGMDNIYYCNVASETAKEAAEESLSVAKYLAYKQLKENNPYITSQQVNDMSMQEIKLLIGCSELDEPCH